MKKKLFSFEKLVNLKIEVIIGTINSSIISLKDIWIEVYNNIIDNTIILINLTISNYKDNYITKYKNIKTKLLNIKLLLQKRKQDKKISEEYNFRDRKTRTSIQPSPSIKIKETLLNGVAK